MKRNFSKDPSNNQGLHRSHYSHRSHHSHRGHHSHRSRHSYRSRRNHYHRNCLHHNRPLRNFHFDGHFGSKNKELFFATILQQVISFF